MKTETKTLLPMVERLMNELAHFWIDSLGSSTKVKSRIRADFEKMCPGIIWEWVKDHNGHLMKIKATGFKNIRVTIG